MSLSSPLALTSFSFATVCSTGFLHETSRHVLKKYTCILGPPEGQHTWYRRVFCCIDRRVIFCAVQNGVLLPVDPHTVDTRSVYGGLGKGSFMSSNLGAKTGLLAGLLARIQGSLHPCTDRLCVEITHNFSNLLKFLASPSAESPRQVSGILPPPHALSS